MESQKYLQAEPLSVQEIQINAKLQLPKKKTGV